MGSECIECPERPSVELGELLAWWADEDIDFDLKSLREGLSGFREDVINDPSHYQILDGAGELICEVRDVQSHVSQGLAGMDAGDMNNAVKYLLRSPFKGKFVEDLKKARRFIDWLIERHDA